MITRIILENWRSHENTSLEFSKGTNVIVGITGAGKSSIMNALCYALFGTFPDLQQRKIKLDDVIMNKPYEKEHARVYVELETNGEKQTIERTITRGKGSTENYYRKNGALIEGPNSKRVTEKITEALGMNYELFSKAVYSEQNNVEYFLEIPRGQRKQKLDELLGITRLEQARKNAGKAAKQLKAKAEEMEKQAKDTPTQEEIQEKEEQLQNLALQTFELEKNQDNKKLQELQQEYLRIKNAGDQHEELQKQKEKEKGRMEALKQKIKEPTRPLQEITEELEKVRKEITTAEQKEKEKRALEKLASEAEGSIARLQKEEHETAKELQSTPRTEDLKKALEKIDKEFLENKSKNQSNRNKIKEIEENHIILNNHSFYTNVMWGYYGK